jgi:hypothetical protein
MLIVTFSEIEEATEEEATEDEAVEEAADEAVDEAAEEAVEEAADEAVEETLVEDAATEDEAGVVPQEAMTGSANSATLRRQNMLFFIDVIFSFQ